MEKYCAGNGVNDGSVERAERLTDGEIEEGIAANEGLVRSIVARMTGERGPELDEDMLQMGRIALWNALRRFNPRRGMKLSSYAVPCIRNCVLDELRRRGRYRGLFVRSLQEPLGEGKEGTWEDVVADERAADPAGDSEEEEERTESVLRRVANLPERDRLGWKCEVSRRLAYPFLPWSGSQRQKRRSTQVQQLRLRQRNRVYSFEIS